MNSIEVFTFLDDTIKHLLNKYVLREKNLTSLHIERYYLLEETFFQRIRTRDRKHFLLTSIKI